MRTDIIVKVEGHIINLEMNESYYQSEIIKNEKYRDRLSSNDLESGESYLNAKRIIQINIDNFHKYKGNKLVYEFIMREKDTGELENDLIVSYHIDLKYLENECYNNNEIEKLFRLFLNKDIENISRDPEIIGLYDAEKVEKKLKNSILEEVKQNGHQEGLKEGLLEGHQQEKIQLLKIFLK